MTLRHIHIFLAVCNAGCNTTHAAKELHMTQPAVSLAIRELEEYYGIKLFDRIGRRLSISQAGKQFEQYAMRIAALFDDMEKTLRDWDQLGTMRVGASMTIGSQFLPAYVKTFVSFYPKADIRVTIAPAEILEQKLMDNSLDLALMERSPIHDCLKAEDYMEDHLTVIAKAGRFHQGQSLSMEDFRKQRFLLRERGSGTREEFEKVAVLKGFYVDPVWESVSTTALINAAANGLGISVLPYRLVQNALSKGLVVSLRVEGLSFDRKFYIVSHKDKLLTPMMTSFLDLCRNYEMDYPIPQYGIE